MNASELWKRYKEFLVGVPSLHLTLDISRMGFEDGFLERMEPSIQLAFDAMSALEGGSIANPDENRMVGHYWLRAPEVAPTKEIADEIRKTIVDVKAFAAAVHSGAIRPPSAPRFSHLLAIGIGGS